jgi:hypothetical protein
MNDIRKALEAAVIATREYVLGFCSRHLQTEAFDHLRRPAIEAAMVAAVLDAESVRAALAAAPVPPAETVHLVCTGVVMNGLETYTRHEGSPPPLSDFETLYAAPPAEAQQPVAWIRRHPDGTLTDETLPNWLIERARRESGAWVPLYAAPTAPTGADAAVQASDADRWQWLRAHWLQVRAVHRRGGVDVECDDQACIGDADDAKRLDDAIDAAMRASQGLMPMTEPRDIGCCGGRVNCDARDNCLENWERMQSSARGIVSGEAGETEGLDPKGKSPVATATRPAPNATDRPVQAAQTAAQEPSGEALHDLARRCLWIAYCWNDHNFEHPQQYARNTAKLHGISSFEDAQAWLAAPPLPTPKEAP